LFLKGEKTFRSAGGAGDQIRIYISLATARGISGAWLFPNTSRSRGAVIE
jgi:hypothetical protein